MPFEAPLGVGVDQNEDGNASGTDSHSLIFAFFAYRIDASRFAVGVEDSKQFRLEADGECRPRSSRRDRSA